MTAHISQAGAERDPAIDEHEESAEMTPNNTDEQIRHLFPGGAFPDYELTDHTKTRRRLSELQGIDPMILVLSRGGFCPKDHQQHLELAANYPKIRVAYTQIVTISTQTPQDQRVPRLGWRPVTPGLRTAWEPATTRCITRTSNPTICGA